MTTRLSVAPATAVALAGGAGLTLALALLGELRDGWLPTAAYAAGCWALGARSRPAAAASVGLAAWLFHNGFVEHRHAELGWNGWATETGRFAFFAGAALLASLPDRKIRTRLLHRP
ncbi:hypothetical protein [Streptomyces sp. TLI_171]|uniref:hypothetical protein n=1 Tax=Streptomyces sp. TLI_171 TaxID=1938859 RepID=UPI000C180930|nr:hypothetical protein [Streptomyces sp. TLI_171]RKE19965.1 hypothetical protein BX266_3298 [Streptomyces sp. TLI_171]